MTTCTCKGVAKKFGSSDSPISDAITQSPISDAITQSPLSDAITQVRVATIIMVASLLQVVYTTYYCRQFLKAYTTMFSTAVVV